MVYFATRVFRAVFGCIFVLVNYCQAGKHEDRLIRDIFTTKNYNSNARPVEVEKDAVEVKFGLSLQSIIGLDEKKEMLHTNMWLNYEWYDYKLKWNSSEYGDVQSIRLPSDKIWTPDILMYNSADERIDSKFPTNVVVYANGLCNWIPIGLYISSCNIDIRWFPFDDQDCIMKFGSWTYSGNQINLTKNADTINIDTYQINGEWDLLEVPADYNVNFYDCCPEPYIDITFHIHIRRRTLYYGFNLIIPCALISVLAIFTFTLPPDTNSKVSLGITILLALSVFQLIVAEMVPSTSISVPLVGVYFACVMVMCTISLIITIVVINFHHQKPEMTEMPPFVQKYINGWLAWLLRMSRPGITPESPFQTATQSEENTDLSLNALESASFPENHAHNPKEGVHSSLLRARSELSAILVELKFITAKAKEDDEAAGEINDWKFAAMVIDRLCLWIFALYFVIATLAIFFSSPNLWASLRSSS